MTTGVGPSSRRQVDLTRGRGCDASTHPIPNQGHPPSGCTPPEGTGRPECVGHPDGVQLSGGQPHLLGRGARALRVIVDTGSGVSLVREALLPPKMKVPPLDAATAQLFDVNRGLQPITGTVTLKLRVGTYSTPVTCGVVRVM